ncbi:MAG: tetratricopeptide repeat protein [Myxococcales bacterium]|nr:tetratricopeptide repeat protein [Myxococcales bacterium]
MGASVLLLVIAGAAPASLEEGAAALEQFRTDDAVALLERARDQGPYLHTDYVRLYEQLGIAYAYQERTDPSLRAFEMLLGLSPGHAIRYTLSPKATFTFEKARKLAAERPEPTLDVGWSRDLTVDNPVTLDVEVVADPLGFLKRATLHWRVRGAGGWNLVPFQLAPPGGRVRQLIPALGSKRSETVEMYLVAADEKGNEVLLHGSPERPREIARKYEPPAPWYSRWQVLVPAGAVLAAATGAVVFAATRPPSPTAEVSLTWPR